MSNSFSLKSNLADLAWQNEYSGWLVLGRLPRPAEPVYRIEEQAGVACAWWQGPPAEAENFLLAAPRHPAAPRLRLDALAPALLTSASAAVLRLPEEKISPDWTQVLTDYGFFATGGDPLMACRLDSTPAMPPNPPQLTVRAVLNQSDQTAALQIIHSVFQGPPALTRFFNPSGTVRLFLGLWEGVPAASATLWPFAGSAGVFSVTTLPAFRHRGLALAVIAALLVEARQSGYPVATLRTRPELFPLYQRLGFQPVGQIACYYRPFGA